MTDERPPVQEWLGPDGRKRRREPSGKIMVRRGMVWREDTEAMEAERKGIVTNIEDWKRRQ